MAIRIVKPASPTPQGRIPTNAGERFPGRSRSTPQGKGREEQHAAMDEQGCTDDGCTDDIGLV
jgi:hypothetical protein